MLVNRKNIEIQWGDCDPLGIVYFPRYFEYFDACTNALFEAVGLPKREMLQSFAIAGIPLVETRASFLAPSRFGDTVVVESRVADWGRSSFSVQHRLYRGEELAVEAYEKRVWTVKSGADPDDIHGEPIPQAVKDKFNV